MTIHRIFISAIVAAVSMAPLATIAEQPALRLGLPPSLLILGASEPETVDPLQASLDAEFPSKVMRGQAFSTSVAVSGGRPPYTITSIGNLPEGVDFEADRTRISGNFMANADAFKIRVNDSSDRPIDLDVGAIAVADPLALPTSVANLNTTPQATAEVTMPAHAGGFGQVSRSVVGSLPTGARFSQETGVLTFDKVVPGTYGPYRFRAADQFDQIKETSQFYVYVRDAGMRLTLPNGAEVFFRGWTAAPKNVTQIEVNYLKWILIRVSCSPSGGALLYVYGTNPTGTIQPHANGSSSCPGAQSWQDWWPTRIGQSLPAELPTIKPGTVPSSSGANLVYSGSQIVWTKVN